MGKCFVFEETGKMIKPRSGIDAQWILANGNPLKSVWPLSNKQYSELKLTEYPSNPLKPILKFSDRWRAIQGDGVNIARDHEAWQAIQKCMAIMEGK
uniref:Uncharacterized protein n=1 Tax=viral metagenome TaxID=1070528 RepID=A0A6H1Z9L1_9ZZZZ